MAKLPRLTRTRAVVLLAVLTVGYFLFAAVGDAFNSHRLSGDEARLEREVAELRRQQRDLAAVRDYLRTDEYVEGVARRILGLVRPGETLVIVSSGAAPTPGPTVEAEEAGEDARWWERLYDP